MINFSNIVREVKIDVSASDFEDAGGFFIRAETAGNIKYVPFGNTDDEVITRPIGVSYDFSNQVLCRKVISSGTTASDIYIGKGM